MKSSKLDNSSVEFTEASPPEESESDPRVKLYTDVERNVDKEFDVGKARTHDDYKIEKDLKSLVKGILMSGVIGVFVGKFLRR